MAIATLYIDTSGLDKLTAEMRAKLTASEFDKLMRRTLKEVGARARTKARSEAKAHYEAPPAFINAAIGAPKVEGGGASLACRIKTVGPKGTIGGTFSAEGGWYGWNPPPYAIRAKIVKGQISTLPSSMSNYGGQPPFRNLGGKGYIGKKTKRKNMQGTSLGTAVYTRTNGAFRAPLRSIPALAVPQMISSRAAPGIENEVIAYAGARVVHNFQYMFG